MKKDFKDMTLKELKELKPRSWGEAMLKQFLISEKEEEIIIKRLATRWGVSYKEAERRYQEKLMKDMERIHRKWERETKKAIEANTCKKCGGIIVRSFVTSQMLTYYGTHRCKCRRKK